ncbi:hypothetical protein GCM10010172_40360 [Paractinoplanes ferrugineus]|uniref:TetR family transcriptional regulator n=1 Tax=Paractinoplanes ferrugineus TaxID=113564 RepID=A0A919JC77_9ACTN|nr:hypothetical protein [Actinoplanes ferrugineus]GIE16644.1 hypothetical protein Afe05nite_84840 [Actinoplanes ferrugineus]
MPRWEHGSAERLTRAASELFEEQARGAAFEETSAVQIAKRGGVTTRTSFRCLPDRKEILFAEADGLRAALVQRLLETTDVAAPLRAVTRALAGEASDHHERRRRGGTRDGRHGPSAPQRPSDVTP